MSDNSLDRQEKALRLLQGMSGIDGELLERSEKTVTASGRILRFTRRYGALCAACLVCAVLGSVYFMNGGWRSEDSGMMEATPMNLTADARNGFAEEDMCEETVLQEAATEVSIADCASAVAWRIPGERSQSVETGLGFGVATQGKENGVSDGNEAEKGANEASLDSSDKQMSGAAFSLQTPAGYTGNSEQELQEDGSGVYTWYREGIPCYVRVVLLDSATIDRLCENGEVLIRDSEGQWLTLLPPADGTGLRQFALSVGNGIVTEYYGYLTEAEIQALFE